MIQAKVICGNWAAEPKERENAINENVRGFLEEIKEYLLTVDPDTEITFVNGGSIDRLECMAESLIDVDVAFWFPEHVEVKEEDKGLFPGTRHIMFKDRIFSEKQIHDMINILFKYHL